MSQRVNKVLERFVSRIEHAEALDPLASKLAELASPLLARRWARGALSGTPIGHPIHPLLVAAPIGSWLGANCLDVFGGAKARPAARCLVGLGMAAAAPAAITGASDWLYTEGAERRVGLVHAVGNYAALGCYLQSWLLRPRHQRLGAVLAGVGTAALAVTGWLGGHLVYARGVGVDTTAFQPAPVEWTAAVAATALRPDRPTLVHVEGVPIALVFVDGQLHAIADRCSHRGGPLHEGAYSDGCLTCPWHGSRFRVADGQVLVGPATRSQRVYEVRTRDGMVEVRRPDEAGSLRANPIA